MGSTVVTISCGTRRGVRAEINQDTIGINGWVLHADSGPTFPPWGDGNLSLELSPGQALVVALADGVGGVAESHTASLIVAEEASRLAIAGSRATLIDGLDAAHRRVLAIAGNRAEAHGIGSTVVGLAVFGEGRMTGFNVGDSRLYYTNADSLVLGSRDDREQLAFSTKRRLAAWVGRADAANVDPYSKVLDPVTSRRVLLCSDGLHAELDEQAIQEIVCSVGASPADIVRQLLAATGETEDDATAVVVQADVRLFEPVVTASSPPAGQRRDVPRSFWSRR